MLDSVPDFVEFVMLFNALILSLWRYILEAINQRNNTTHMPDALLIEKLDKNFGRL